MAASDGVTITFEIKLPLEAVEPFLQAVNHMVTATAEFPGFRSLRIVQHIDDPARILFVELWESVDDYKKYIAWRTERGEMDALKTMAISIETNFWPHLVVEK